MAQYAKTPEVRRGILDACLAAFSDSGFHGASMAEIARRAGISHTGLLHHFPRKGDLLTAVLDLQDQHSADFLRSHATLAPLADPLVVLRGLTATLIEREDRAGLIELNAVLTGEATAPLHPAHDHFTARYRRVRSFMTRLFEGLRADGRLSVDAPSDRLAGITIAAVDGLHLQWLFDRDDVDVDTSVTDLLAAFVPELTAPE